MMVHTVMLNGAIEAVFDNFKTAYQLAEVIKSESDNVECYVDTNVVESSVEDIDR